MAAVINENSNANGEKAINALRKDTSGIEERLRTQITELPAITGAEFRSMRESLGLSHAWMARYLMCDDRRLARMEVDQEDIPDKFAGRIDDLSAETTQLVDDLAAKYQVLVHNRSGGEAELAVYRNDKEYRADRRRKVDHASKFSASWHRMVGQRVADAVPGVILVYKEPAVRKPKPWERDNGKSPRQTAPAPFRHATNV